MCALWRDLSRWWIGAPVGEERCPGPADALAEVLDRVTLQDACARATGVSDSMQDNCLQLSCEND